VVILEITLRVAGIYKTYSEKIGSGYYSYYGQKLPTWYHHWPKNKLNCFKQPEFNYCYQYNSLGLRDQEWQYRKAENKNRLIILGDSFTEGDGATNNNNFPSYFSKRLNAYNNSWEVYNAGVCERNF
jgi:hypothetical protein